MHVANYDVWMPCGGFLEANIRPAVEIMFSWLRGSLWGVLPVWSGAGAGAILKAVLLTKLVLLHWLMLESLEPCRSSESTCGSHGHAGPSPLVALRRGKMRARLALESDGWWGATRKLVCCTGAGLVVSAVGMMPRSGLRCLLARSLLVLRLAGHATRCTCLVPV